MTAQTIVTTATTTVAATTMRQTVFAFSLSYSSIFLSFPHTNLSTVFACVCSKVVCGIKYKRLWDFCLPLLWLLLGTRKVLNVWISSSVCQSNSANLSIGLCCSYTHTHTHINQLALWLFINLRLGKHFCVCVCVFSYSRITLMSIYYLFSLVCNFLMMTPLIFIANYKTTATTTTTTENK